MKTLPAVTSTLLLFLASGCVNKQALQTLSIDDARSAAESAHSVYGESGTTMFMRDAGGGNMQAVTAALASGVDLAERNARGHTALMFAAEWGRLPVVKLLIEHGADVAAQNMYGHTPLFLAAGRERLTACGPRTTGCRFDHVGVVDFLVELDAPLVASTDSHIDAEYTARAFWNVATAHRRSGAHSSSRELLPTAQAGFSHAAKYFADQAQAMAELDRSISFFNIAIPVLEAANEAFQSRIWVQQMADASALRQADQHNLGIDQTLVLIRERRQAALSATPGLATPSLAVSEVPEDEASTDLGRLPERARNARQKLIGTFLWPAVETGSYDLIRMRAYQEQAALVGVMIECHDGQLPDDELQSCADWVQAGIDSVKDLVGQSATYLSALAFAS